ncbi:MAG: anaerobic ribonucleoside-triphosphate reductase activating protein [Deltaproteobacteria bacterium]|nr:anaerobic ribonucleoside-triphosphate reductase activating protein [Deltaproteobacteria bacterium]
MSQPRANNIILNFLKQRQGLLDGVVISGGEPTLQPGLFAFCQKLKELGYAVKLDTNGTRPDVIRGLLRAGLVDYIAMDIKAALVDYSLFTPKDSVASKIQKSIQLIMEFASAYEFRTTCIKPIINEASVRSIAEMIEGAMLYALQRLRKTRVLRPDFFENGRGTCEDSELHHLRSIALHFVKDCIIR